MKDLKKLLKDDESGSRELKTLMKMRALEGLSDEMGKMSGASVLEKMLKPKAAVTVATDDPKKLPEALKKAEELTKKLPSMEEMKDEYLGKEDDEEEKEEMMDEEAESEKEESEEKDIDSMSPEELRAELLKLKKMMK
jgi:hypothetical protein